MTKMEIEEGNALRFVRSEETMVIGPNHLEILKKMGWPTENLKIAEEIKRRSGMSLGYGISNTPKRGDIYWR